MGAKRSACTCGVQSRPEAITGSREMVSGCRRIEPGIDAAEQDPQVGRDHILEPLSRRRGELGLSGPRVSGARR